MLVIGGRGYVGNHILNKAGLMGIESYSISRRPVESINNDSPNINFVQGDALKPESFEDIIKKCDSIGKKYF